MHGTIYVIPKRGQMVRDPRTSIPVPPQGAWYDDHHQWQRYARDGDVTLADAPPAEDAMAPLAPSQPQSAPTAPSPVSDDMTALRAQVQTLTRQYEAMRRLTQEIVDSVNGKVKAAVDDARRDFAAALQNVVLHVEASRIERDALDNAYSIRASMPVGWKPGDVLTVPARSILQAQADRDFGGDVGAAVIAITNADLEWQQAAADKIRGIA